MRRSLLRLWCYCTLGRHFAFELAIQPGHLLIETNPYAVVHHPSYTGMILAIFGAYLNQEDWDDWKRWVPYRLVPCVYLL